MYTRNKPCFVPSLQEHRHGGFAWQGGSNRLVTLWAMFLELADIRDKSLVHKVSAAPVLTTPYLMSPTSHTTLSQGGYTVATSYMDTMLRLSTSKGIQLISFPQTYPSRQIHWGSAHSLHHRHILLQEPSTPLQRCSAYEGACLPVLYCGARKCRSRELRQSAPPLRESPGRMPSRGWWLDSGGRKLTHPWGKHKLHCRRWPGRIWNKMLRLRHSEPWE